MTLIIIFFLLVLLIRLVYPIIKVKLGSSVKPGRLSIQNQSEVQNLYEYVYHLSVNIGSRSVYEYQKIKETEDYLITILKGFGYDPEKQTYEYHGNYFNNIIITIPGQKEPEEIFIIGAHYDTVFGTPGADDNASGVAILVEICRISRDYQPSRTLKLIFFVLEEPPTFKTRYMGSYIYAKHARENKEKISGMISLEMVGYYNNKKGAQTFPLPFMSLFYPNTPNFIGVVGNLKSRELVKKIKNSIKKGSSIPVESISTVRFIPGIDFSDHGSFWEMGYSAAMITDTSFYRNPNYHTSRDTIDTLNFGKMADLLNGLIQVVKDVT